MMRLIDGICEETDRMKGSSNTMHWWYQADINFEGSLETATAREEEKKEW